eukprot:751473-Hanusia_phi.AAC.2
MASTIRLVLALASTIEAAAPNQIEPHCCPHARPAPLKFELDPIRRACGPARHAGPAAVAADSDSQGRRTPMSHSASSGHDGMLLA